MSSFSFGCLYLPQTIFCSLFAPTYTLSCTFTVDVVNIPEEAEQDVASETSLDEEVIADERRNLTELMEYGQKLEKSNSDEKE